MPYRYRCPLCLTRLESGETLIVFKTDDPTGKKKWRHDRVNCGEQNFVKKILDFGGMACFTSANEKAVFVSHVKCTAQNPFWDGQKIDLPGGTDGGRELTAELVCVRTGQNFNKKLSHWVIGMLRTTYAYGDKHRPMWYPFPLLLATAAENTYDSSRPFGCLVEVASTKDAGKTILTLQLLNDVLYKNGRALNVRDYFYPKTDFKEELYFRSIWRSRPASRPAPTNPSAGDMRAIFVRPAIVPALDQPADGNGVKQGRWQSLKQWVKGDVKEGAKYFLESTFDTAPEDEEKRKQETFDLNKMLEEQRRQFWKPVLFFDTAGESQEKRDRIIEAVSEITNKLAIVVDARDVFDIDSWRDDHNASIRHACERISDMQQMTYLRKDTCIVVTKLDMVSFTPEEKERVKNIAEGVGIGAGDDAAQALLVHWLRERSDDDKEGLIQHLSPEEDVVRRVFFVWTENLPKMRGIRLSPIFAFRPLTGSPGEEVTITANPGFNFQDAKKVLFDGREADFDITSDTEIKARVPQGASSGYIDIVLEGVNPSMNQPYEDDANSEGIFIVTGSKKPAVVGKPHSYGLVKFLAWCLNTNVEAITREAQV